MILQPLYILLKLRHYQSENGAKRALLLKHSKTKLRPINKKNWTESKPKSRKNLGRKDASNAKKNRLRRKKNVFRPLTFNVKRKKTKKPR